MSPIANTCRRLLREQAGFIGRVWVGLAMAVALAGGGLIYQQVDNGTPAAGSANLWVDTSGGTCTRQSSAGAYVDAQACGSLDAAYDAASCGDTVIIKPGTYGSQTATGTKACSDTWTVGSARGVTCTSCVSMSVDSGATVSLGATSLDVDFLYLARGDGSALNIAGFSFSGSASNVAVDGFSSSSDTFINPNGTGTGPYANLAVVNGSIGGFNVGSGSFCTSPCPSALAIYMQTSVNISSVYATNILVDGVSFHDIATPGFVADPNNNHTGIIRIDGGYDGVTIRNSNFYDNLQVSSNFISETTIFGPAPENVTIANNYFGDPGYATGAIGYYVAGTYCQSHKVLYNTAVGTGLFQSNSCSPTTGMIWAGNVSVKPGECMGTHLHNVYSGGTCGGTDTSSSSWGLGGANGFEPQAGSVLLRAGETTYCPVTDHDGNTRPNPGATNCDAGAFESSS